MGEDYFDTFQSLWLTNIVIHMMQAEHEKKIRCFDYGLSLSSFHLKSFQSVKTITHSYVLGTILAI